MRRPKYPAMIIVLPLRNGLPTVTPRHMVIPFQCGGPSSG